MLKHEQKNIICLVYPNAYVYCDKSKREYNDLMEIARVYFNDATVKMRKNSILPDKTLKAIENDIKRIKSHEKIEVSACGQYIIGGCDI